jgi:photosystem II stability/assembly factor-like uncharacterized protein
MRVDLAHRGSGSEAKVMRGIDCVSNTRRPAVSATTGRASREWAVGEGATILKTTTGGNRPEADKRPEGAPRPIQEDAAAPFAGLVFAGK